MTDVAQVLAEVQKAEGTRLVARLIRITGDWALAEDCVQDALVKAWQRWPRDGVPERPGAWLATTARNIALDRWRRTRVEAQKIQRLGADVARGEEDDTLALVFSCCHPALPLDGQVALTLKFVGGLSTAEVARAFLVSEDTMTRRLTRARTKIQQAGIPFQVPTDPWRTERLQGVLGVLYLLFNRGNDSPAGINEQSTLGPEAIRLARLLVGLLPTEGEAKGALALMLMTWARRPARYDTDGAFITMDLQDRRLWDQASLAEGLSILDDALSNLDDGLTTSPGPYTLQAAIAGCHARASRAEDTDFARIAGLYTRLQVVAPSPVVRLNLAVARGFSEGPGVGLALVEALADEPSLAQYHYLPAVRAEFLGRLGRTVEAIEAYRQAEALAPSGADRRFLADKRRLLVRCP